MSVIIKLILVLFFGSISFQQAYAASYSSEIAISQADISTNNILEQVKSTSIEGDTTFSQLRSGDVRNNTLVYFGFIFIFFILVYIKVTSPEFYEDLFLSFFRSNYLIDKLGGKRPSFSINNFLLDIVFMAVVSFLFYELSTNVIDVQFFYILAGVAIFITLQVVIVWIFYNIFFGSSGINIHLNHILNSNRIIGIILAPSLFISIYLDPLIHKIALEILLYSLILIIIIRIYRILTQLKIIFHYTFLMIFIYICAFEISVYFLFFKLISFFTNS